MIENKISPVINAEKINYPTLDELKNFLRIDCEIEDMLLDDLLKSSVSLIEKFIDKKLSSIFNHDLRYAVLLTVSYLYNAREQPLYILPPAVKAILKKYQQVRII